MTKQERKEWAEIEIEYYKYGERRKYGRKIKCFDEWIMERYHAPKKRIVNKKK